MGSLAKVNFDSMLERADLLISQASKIKRGDEAEIKKVLLHAALAAQVAAWDAYVKSVLREYFKVSANQTDLRFSAMHELLRLQLEQELKKFNTPNSENCRNILMRFANFDPWPHWIEIKLDRSKITSSLVIRNRLDEILKMRHSFAHGFAIPAFIWNSSPLGAATLNCSILRGTKDILRQICSRTDKALAHHVAAQHGTAAAW